MKIKVELVRGSVAASMAGAFWNALDMPGRRAILWEVEMKKRAGYLGMAWFNCDWAGLGWLGDDLAAAAWVGEICPGSRCGHVHFAFAPNGRELAFDFSSAFHESLALRNRYFTLLGLVPVPFHGAIRLAAKSGYRKLSRLPMACPLAARGRIVDGWLLQKDLRAN